MLGNRSVPGEGGPVDTLQYVLKTLDATSAGGVLFHHYKILSKIKTEKIKHILKLFFCQGSWGYDRTWDGPLGPVHFHADTHSPLVSV